MMAIKYYGAIELILLLASVLLAPHLSQVHLVMVADFAPGANSEAPHDADTEPPFPLLFQSSPLQAIIGRRNAKIVAEIIGENSKTTTEEYLDLELRRAAYVTARTDLDPLGPQSRPLDPQRQAILSHSSHDQIYIYKPYSCTELPMHSQQLYGIENWSILLDFEAETTAADNYQEANERILRIFGVAAIWAYAAVMPKKYALTGTVYSTEKDIYKVGHQWTVRNEQDKVQFKLGFIANNMNADQVAQGGYDMSLETVQISALDTGAVLRTFNVLSVEYGLSMDAYKGELEVPVGYGCQVMSAGKPGQTEEFRRDLESIARKFSSSSRLDLEVSGTKIDPATGARLSDTIYVEVVHALDKLHGDRRKLSMVVVKSSTSETKTISNHAFNVRYTIDMQKGSCTMGYLADAINWPEGEPHSYADNPSSELLLQFSNGLKLSLEPEQMDYLFFNVDNYVVVKESSTELSSGEALIYTYLERTIYSWPPHGAAKTSGQFARQVLTVLRIEGPEGSDGGAYLSSSRLHSVTLWVFPDKTSTGKATIEAAIHINVINYETGLSRWPDVPRLFDVSHECYVQDENMHPGQDYAWVEFFYPLSSHQLDILEGHDSSLARALHTELTLDSELLTSFQVPKLELMFGDEGLTVRALLLDVPSLHLMYAPFEGRSIDLDKGRGDLALVAPDIRHCSKLCRQYACKSMTFCSGARSCLLGTRPALESSDKAPEANAKTRLQTMSPNGDCRTYSANGSETGPASLLPSLHSVLARIKHYDYDTEGMPRLPDDVLSLPNWRMILQDHERRLREHFAKRGVQQMVLFRMLDEQLFSLIPTSVLIEDDPFEQFGADVFAGAAPDDADDADEILHDGGRIVAYFHEGLSMSRYQLNAFRGRHEDKARQLVGVTYDQCALGCFDSKCGTLSYCPSRKECILTSFSLIAEASREKLIEEDGECFIAQRDFTSNFQVYPNIAQPLSALASSTANSVSDCALTCMLYDGHRTCVSFEYCSKTARHDNCYLQSERHPEHVFKDSSPTIVASAAAGEGKLHVDSDSCDHYERSQLAEFNRIESTQLSGELLDKSDSITVRTGKTTLECADICLNQLDDCSAFQFCLNYSNSGDNHLQECLMIHGGLPAAKDTGGQNKLELVIDPSERGNGSQIKASKYLKHNDDCQVFALRPNTIEGHLRELALGNTLTIGQKREFEREPVVEYRTAWATYMLIFMGTAILASQLSLGFCWAYQRNEAVRHQIDRLRFRVRL